MFLDNTVFDNIPCSSTTTQQQENFSLNGIDYDDQEEENDNIQLNNQQNNFDIKKKPEKTSNSSYCEHIDVEKGQVKKN